ncbi:MAG: LPS assembly lipoprotein LptE [Desulfobacterales bacterium]|nr:LPS assembly lipoprotein LptE [Desulfobacterales bacterium]MDD4072286.1 LPS assembly lipoprotein LptE [Desulfobacterales bacterium]MDD4392697.1 LPS assembly lipoprotein LptE [Desulfobacterales bacterium]
MSTVKKYIPIFFLLFFMMACSGCGYRFSGNGVLPGNVQSIFINVFENRTAETGIESVFSNDLVIEFIRNGNPVANERDRADAFLHGTVKSMTIDSVSHRDSHTSIETRVTVCMDLKMMDSQGDVIWSANNISDSEVYLVVSEKSVTEQNRRIAISEISKRIAEKVYYRLTDRF